MSREISFSEVKQHKTNKSCWIVIHNNVYDVTSYLGEHPGGEDALLEVAGQDGTQAFEDVGHSDDAREIMKKFKIGTLPADEIAKMDADNTTARLKWAVLALAGAVVIGLVLKKYLAT